MTQVLALTFQLGGVAAQLDPINRVSLIAPLPLHGHLCPAGHASLWWQIQLWESRIAQKQFWFLLAKFTNRLSGNKPYVRWRFFFMFSIRWWLFYLPFSSMSYAVIIVLLILTNWTDTFFLFGWLGWLKRYWRVRIGMRSCTTVLKPTVV